MSTQLNVKTVLFQTIQFRISTQFNSICPIDRTLSGATTLGPREPGSDGNEGVLCIPQSSSIIRTSPSDCFVSYPGHSLGGDLTPLQRCSRYILQPQLTGQSVFWDEQGILFINYLEKGRTINSKYQIALLVCLKEEIAKKWPQMKKKKVLFQQVDRNNDKTTWIALQITSAPTLFSRSGPQQLLADCRPQKNAPRQKAWLQ